MTPREDAERPEGRSIAEEISQSQPFRSERQEAMLALLRTADDAKRFMSAVIEPTGVTLQQYNVLRILRGAGPEGLPTLEVGERMIERTPGVTRIVDRLGRKGLVERERGVEDRRVVFCRITEEGLELLSSLDEPVDHVDEEVMRGLDDEECRTLIALLESVRAGLD